MLDLQFDVSDVLKRSSGGRIPVRQLKKRAALRKKGSIPIFTLCATELPDKSGISLQSKQINKT